MIFNDFIIIGHGTFEYDIIIRTHNILIDYWPHLFFLLDFKMPNYNNFGVSLYYLQYNE